MSKAKYSSAKCQDINFELTGWELKIERIGVWRGGVTGSLPLLRGMPLEMRIQGVSPNEETQRSAYIRLKLQGKCTHEGWQVGIWNCMILI